jgi:3-oxosteroid 1-dehydrogenase
MSWDHSFDFLVMGSGAGGLTGALFARDLGGDVLVVEKGPHFGGTSAMSGGAIWVPCNHFLPELGVEDNRELALQYLTNSTRGEVDRARLEAYVDHAPTMVKELEERSHVKFQPLVGYPDYDDHMEGALPSGRTLGAVPWHAKYLGAAFGELHPCHPQTNLLGSSLLEHAHEAPLLMSTALRSRMVSAWRLARSIGRIPSSWVHGRDPFLTMGQALMARLRASLIERKVPLWLKATITELVTEHGGVVGAVVERDGTKKRVEVRRGVLLASGGFCRDPELIAKHQRQPAKVEWASSNLENTGGAVHLCESVGAAFEFMDSALWAPVSVVPGQELPYLIVLERCLPGSLIVDEAGKRFADESLPFPEFAKTMLDIGERVIPARLIASAAFRLRYILGAALPGMIRPTLSAALRDGYLRRYPTLEALAEGEGMEPATVRATVERFNGFARAGVDEDFNRGTRILGRFYGDPTVEPNPTMAPLEKGPFYVLDLYPGNIGTLGGPRVDTVGAVLKPDGERIEGLYAVGNCASPLVGRAYPASGATIGPAMAFAYLAAKHAFEEASPA